MYQRLGGAAEDQGRTAEALEYYTLLIRLRQDCDASLVATRDQIAVRLAALKLD